MNQLDVNQVRRMFKAFLPSRINDDGMLELTSISFVADEDTIFGKPDPNYIKREIDWYMSQSLSIDDMEPPIPRIWEDISSEYGYINSNYGWCLFHPEGGHYYDPQQVTVWINEGLDSNTCGGSSNLKTLSSDQLNRQLSSCKRDRLSSRSRSPPPAVIIIDWLP